MGQYRQADATCKLLSEFVREAKSPEADERSDGLNLDRHAERSPLESDRRGA